MQTIKSTVLAAAIIYQCLNFFKKKKYFMYKIHMELAYANNNLDKF